MAQATISAPATGAHAQVRDAFAAVMRSSAHMRFPLPNGRSVEKAAFAALALLRDQGPQRGSDIAARLGLDLSTVSRQMSNLGRDGYVKKVADPGDGRAHLHSLTRAGRTLVDKGQQIRSEFMAEALSSWSEEDLRTFARLLLRFRDDIATARERQTVGCS